MIIVVPAVVTCAISASTWVLAPGGGFDAPHAAIVSCSSAEGSGVGTSEEPPVPIVDTCSAKPVSEKEVVRAAQNGCVHLSFEFHLAEQTQVVWETIVLNGRVYLSLSGSLPKGSKEAFVSLLEYAEEVLCCSHVLVCFNKSRHDRAILVKTFMFLGFQPLPPNHPLAPGNNDHLFMLYQIE